MNTILLASLIFTQLSTFQFGHINSPQTAGDSFDISIVALTANDDTFRYNFTGLLKTTRDDFWNYCEPQLVDFYQGVCRRKVRVSIADTLSLKCEANGVIGYSNQFTVIPNYPERLLILCPGESIAPGSAEGKFSQPASQIAGASFSIQIIMVDKWFNPVSNRSDMIYLSATDSFAQFTNSNLINGRIVLPVTLRRAANHKIFARTENAGIRADTSVSIEVFPGTFDQLVLLLPGESLLPGDTTTFIYLTPGKTGVTARQYVKEPFIVKVIATDACYNHVQINSDTVSLTSDFAMHFDPAQAVLYDSAVFSVTFDSTGDNQNLWVLGRTFDSYRSRLNIEAKTKNIVTVQPDSIRAGAIVTIEATLYDANNKIIKGKYTSFTVTSGHGTMIDSGGITNTDGMVRAQFVCNGANSNETDSIAITADDYTHNIAIVIEGDETVLSGQVIAFPNPFGYNRGQTEIQYFLPKSCDVTVSIYDPFGNLVKTQKFQPGEEGAKLGINKITWDGKNGKGKAVANGIYVFKAWGTDFTGRVFDKEHRIAVIW